MLSVVNNNLLWAIRAIWTAEQHQKDTNNVISNKQFNGIGFEPMIQWFNTVETNRFIKH